MNNNQIQLIEARIKAAYNSREFCEVSGQWRMDTMRRIRQLGPVLPPTKYLASFEQFIWHLTPVACILILCMGTLIVHFGLIPDTQLVKFIINEKEEALSLFSMMGLG